MAKKEENRAKANFALGRENYTLAIGLVILWLILLMLEVKTDDPIFQ
jgi:hypothetical protein